MSTREENSFGLTKRDMETLFSIFEQYPDIRKVFLFGSRAKGNHKTGSDIDLVIMNTGLQQITLRRVNSDFEESSLPYRVDLVNYHSTTHRELREHIDLVGVPFYERQ